MTDGERRLLVAKWAEVLHLALVEIRYLAWQGRNDQRIADLADLVHNLPHFMLGYFEHMHGYIREAFVKYAQTYRPDEDLTTDRFVSILDMDEQTFVARHQRRSWHWPDAGGAAN